MCIYVRPRYSPIAPKTNSWQPPINSIRQAKEVQPITATSIRPLIFKTIKMDPANNPINENVAPINVAILKGKMEKLVTIFDHKKNDFISP